MHPLEAKLADAWPPESWQDVTVLVAVSGGADSVALVRAMNALKSGGAGRLWLAHLDHQLRGQASTADAEFVCRLAGDIGLAYEVGRLAGGDLPAPAGKGIEAAARRARYRFLRRAAERLGARYVVTAHNADDQAETILHRVLRGTGVRGLAGMPRVRPLGDSAVLIRPLLGVRHAELLAYLGDLGQDYRTDATNADTRFTRNRIRHQLLPRLAQDFNPDVVGALLRLGRLAGEVQGIVDGLVGQLLDRCVIEEAFGSVIIDAGAMNDQPRYLRREFIVAVWRRQGWPMQSMGFDEWDALAAMLAGGGGRRSFPGQVAAESAGDLLRLTRK